MTNSERPDDLVARYQEASAQDPRQPATRVRSAVRAHAQLVLEAGTQHTALSPSPQAAAANQARWRISMLASVAVLGLAGMLLLQLDRATPEEKALVAGRSDAGRLPTADSTQSVPAVAVPSRAAAVPAIPKVPAAPAVRATPAAPVPATRRATDVAGATGAPDAATAMANAPAAGPSSIDARAAKAAANSSDGQSALAERQQPQAAAEPAPASAGAGLAAPAAKTADALLGVQTPALRKELNRTDSTLPSIASRGAVTELDAALAQGAALNAPDEAGRTPLMLAVINGHAEMVQRLLAAGANPALRDHQGLTALQHARRLRLDRISSLIEAGS